MHPRYCPRNYVLARESNTISPTRGNPCDVHSYSNQHPCDLSPLIITPFPRANCTWHHLRRRPSCYPRPSVTWQPTTIPSTDAVLYRYKNLRPSMVPWALLCRPSKILVFGSEMRSAILTRSRSIHVPNQLHVGSRPGSEFSSLRRSVSISPRCALKIKSLSKSTTTANSPLRRARSDTDRAVSDRPSRILSPPEEDEEDRDSFRRSSATAGVILPGEGIESAGGASDGGMNIGGGGDGGGGGGDKNDNERIENYYRQMLRSDPSNPLLLRNYGKFLHEVEGDVKGAEECYGRAILASPKDGEVLSLYGRLVWETERDEERAGVYFQRAVEASPDDCYVLGSYASFLWDAEEDDGEEETKESSSPPLLVKAF